MKRRHTTRQHVAPKKTPTQKKPQWNSNDVAEVVELAVEIWNTVRAYHPTWRAFAHPQPKFTAKPTQVKKPSNVRKFRKTTKTHTHYSKQRKWGRAA